MCESKSNLKPTPEELQQIELSTTQKIKNLLDYARTKYGCEFPKGFTKKMYSLMRERIVPENYVIDAIVAEWHVWEPYVTPDSFNRFVISEIESMFWINTTSTFHSPVLRGYIGNKANVIKKLPAPMATTVSMEGVLSKDGREWKFFKPKY